MNRLRDTTTFDSRIYEASVADMRARRERVHDLGEQVLRETGQIHPNVDIRGKMRVSHNAMVPNDTGDGTSVLANGIAWPLVSFFDGTCSMGGNVAKAHAAAGAIDAMLSRIRDAGANTQLAAGVVQDVVDHYPVVQMTQYESDNRRVEQLRLLLPAMGGGDAIEDYDLALAYMMLGLDLDIWQYGLKGYAFIVADEIGRGIVRPRDVQQHLGHVLQSQMTTQAICQKLLSKLHLFYLQVGNASRRDVSQWWNGNLGRGRTIQVPNPNLLAEAQAGLVYVTEVLEPTQEGLREFLLAEGANKRISQQDTSKIWQWLQQAVDHFSAQAQLIRTNGPLPRPGDVFRHYRDAWPIGHPREHENNPVLETTDQAEGTNAAPKPTGSSIDWEKF